MSSVSSKAQIGRTGIMCTEHRYGWQQAVFNHPNHQQDCLDSECGFI